MTYKHHDCPKRHRSLSGVGRCAGKGLLTSRLDSWSETGTSRTYEIAVATRKGNWRTGIPFRNVWVYASQMGGK